MSSYRSLTTLLIAFVFTTMLTACGGSSSDDTSQEEPRMQVSGNVIAPVNSIAGLQRETPAYLVVLDFILPSAWSALTGLTPVANATIELVRIDDDGNPVGNALRTTTSNSNGAYTLELPADVDPSGNLVVQVKNSLDQPVLQAMVIGETVNIDPVSQIVLDTLVDEAGVILANLNIDNVQALLNQLTAINLDFSSALTLADAHAIVENSAEVSQVLNDKVAAVANTALIIGAWGDGTTDPLMLVLYSNGFYVHWQDCTDSGDGAGVEYGNYIYDGEILRPSPIRDDNGGCGLSGSQSRPVSLDAEALHFGGSDPVTLVRVWNREPSSLSGGWDTRVRLQDPAGLVFYENGTYIQLQAEDPDGDQCPGVEYGTYTFNGTDLDGSIIYDENDSCGLGDGTGSFPSITASVSDNLIIFNPGLSDEVAFGRVETSDPDIPSGGGGSDSGGNVGNDSIESVSMTPSNSVGLQATAGEIFGPNALLGINLLRVTFGDGSNEWIECNMHHYSAEDQQHILHCTSTVKSRDIYFTVTSSNSSVILLYNEFDSSLWRAESSGNSQIRAQLTAEDNNASVTWNVSLTIIP